MPGDPAYLRRLLYRVDFPVAYDFTDDANEVVAAFGDDLVRVTRELGSTEGIGRVEGMRQVFDIVGGSVLARGTIEIKEIDFTSAASCAILDLLEIGFVYHTEQNAWVAEGVL